MPITQEGGKETDLELVRLALAGGGGDEQQLIARAFLRAASHCLREDKNGRPMLRPVVRALLDLTE